VSERARTWLLRLLALGIAIGIWFNASVEDRLVSSEKVVEVGITYNRPRGFMILNSPQNVQVRLLGSKKAIRQLNPYMVDVQVALSQRQEGSAIVNLSRENVQAPDGLEVVSIEPNTIRVDLEREVTQRVTVILDADMMRQERLNFSGYPPGPVAYFEYIAAWRSSGRFEGLTFRGDDASAVATG